MIRPAKTNTHQFHPTVLYTQRLITVQLMAHTDNLLQLAYIQRLKTTTCTIHTNKTSIKRTTIMTTYNLMCKLSFNL